MRLEPGYLFGMALQTIPEPRKVARDLFDFGFAREALWTGFALVIVLASVMSVFANILFPVDPEIAGPLLASPILLGIIEAVFMFCLIWAIYIGGRLFGGAGTLSQAIITVTWMEMLFIGVQAISMLLSFFAPGIAVLLIPFSGFLFFWVLSQFTAESHGFTSAGLVFVTFLFGLMVAVFVLSLVLVLMGVEPITFPQAPTPN